MLESQLTYSSLRMHAKKGIHLLSFFLLSMSTTVCSVDYSSESNLISKKQISSDFSQILQQLNSNVQWFNQIKFSTVQEKAMNKPEIQKQLPSPKICDRVRPMRDKIYLKSAHPKKMKNPSFILNVKAPKTTSEETKMLGIHKLLKRKFIVAIQVVSAAPSFLSPTWVKADQNFYNEIAPEVIVSHSSKLSKKERVSIEKKSETNTKELTTQPTVSEQGNLSSITDSLEKTTHLASEQFESFKPVQTQLSFAESETKLNEMFYGIQKSRLKKLSYSNPYQLLASNGSSSINKSPEKEKIMDSNIVDQTSNLQPKTHVTHQDQINSLNTQSTPSLLQGVVVTEDVKTVSTQDLNTRVLIEKHDIAPANASNEYSSQKETVTHKRVLIKELFDSFSRDIENPKYKIISSETGNQDLEDVTNGWVHFEKEHYIDSTAWIGSSSKNEVFMLSSNNLSYLLKKIANDSGALESKLYSENEPQGFIYGKIKASDRVQFSGRNEGIYYFSFTENEEPKIVPESYNGSSYNSELYFIILGAQVGGHLTYVRTDGTLEVAPVATPVFSKRGTFLNLTHVKTHTFTGKVTGVKKSKLKEVSIQVVGQMSQAYVENEIELYNEDQIQGIIRPNTLGKFQISAYTIGSYPLFLEANFEGNKFRYQIPQDKLANVNIHLFSNKIFQKWIQDQNISDSSIPIVYTKVVDLIEKFSNDVLYPLEMKAEDESEETASFFESKTFTISPKGILNSPEHRPVQSGDERFISFSSTDDLSVTAIGTVDNPMAKTVLNFKSFSTIIVNSF